ncbi:MAG: hypothetical protein LH465_02240 [Sphingomonas bacterium]|nr:hypothetical protein [Sphingomonas bacterium]
MRLAPPYLGAMAVLPPMSSPRAALRDLLAVLRADSVRDRILGLTLAVLITIIILIIFFVDSKINTAPPPRVVYVQTYAEDRTDADIKTSQKQDQARRKKLAAERRKQFQELERRFNIE